MPTCAPYHGGETAGIDMKQTNVITVSVWISVVRYPRYLGKYRDTTCDDTSIAKVTVNRGPTIP